MILIGVQPYVLLSCLTLSILAERTMTHMVLYSLKTCSEDMELLMSETQAANVTNGPATSARQHTPRWLVIIVACIFAAIIPETVLTSSTSVLKIIVNPASVVYLSIFYGTAMLIIREAIIRRPASWLSVVLLGIAFGCCNEGVVAGTWYTVRNDGYLFFGSVDVAWAVGLTVFHLFISMLLTIAFTDILFPSRAGQPLLGRRGSIIAPLLFVLCNALVVFAPNFRAERLIVLGAVLLLAVIALRLPPTRLNKVIRDVPPPRFWVLRLVGFLTYMIYFVLLYFYPLVIGGLPGVSPDVAQYIIIATMVGFAAIVLMRGVGWLRTNGWGVRHNLALMTGVVVFEVLITTLVSSQVALLEPVATVPIFLFLLVRNWQLQRRERVV